MEGSVYLLGGDGSRGRVQYCNDGTWHSVCADDWDSTGIEARVVCQSAGYDTSGYGKPHCQRRLHLSINLPPPPSLSLSLSVPSVVDYGRGTSPILPVNIQCASGASTLSDCFTPGQDVSQCTDVAGVDCRGMYTRLSVGELFHSLIPAAPCVTEGLTNCASCVNPLHCFNFGFSCNCYSDCFAKGDCCSDISLTRNCFRE